ncbi:MAG TPA: hypothetical protein VHB50_23370 [Bryobacteraceae bacterium]|nr:hypothetical protein [Bryobacteraceae bacterium]
MRTRRLIWLLAAILSIGALSAVQPARSAAPFAGERPLHSQFVLDAAAREQRSAPLRRRISSFCQTIARSVIRGVRGATNRIDSTGRFQRPPPSVG